MYVDESHLGGPPVSIRSPTNQIPSNPSTVLSETPYVRRAEISYDLD